MVEGVIDGDLDGRIEMDGIVVGASEANSDGAEEGRELGASDGDSEGRIDMDGIVVGASEANSDGA